MFYETALKTLEREYGNPLLVSHLKFKKFFDQPQIKNQDLTALREYQHQFKCSNTWFYSMGYYDALSSTENLAKAVKKTTKLSQTKILRKRKRLRFRK